MYDVIIIGAGVAGAFIARELSRYDVKTSLVEKETDVSMGTSKGNSAIIHAGFDAKPGTFKAKLNVRGSRLMGRIAEELDVPFKQVGSLVLCFSESDLPRLYELEERGRNNGVEGLEIVSGDRLRDMEPNISPATVAALHAPSAGIISPFELTLKAAENAVENGAELKLGCEVTGISFKGGHFHLSTPAGVLESRYLVNAAGLYADEISRMAGDDSFTVSPRKGEYILYDKKLGNLVNKVVFQLPTDKGKGVLVTPTVHGNLLIGPNADEISDKADTSTTEKGLAEIMREAIKTAPSLNRTDIITAFAGLRAGTESGDFIIKASEVNNRLIHAAGIESPGLSAAPAIGELVAELLKENGLAMRKKTDFNPVSKHIKRFREMDAKELNEMIKTDPSFGRIVCRCERVTEGEVAESIRSTIGATDLDGVKRRTRAGMGRCQGGFCSCRVVEILSRELEIPMEEITKAGGKSRVLAAKIK